MNTSCLMLQIPYLFTLDHKNYLF
ncbi:hypothetical protein NC651_037996 [Populus alba x Populus x berolinensis]|nr:hypothetical protein NC651_037996 [Populus alba x Populus x berolinensis]